MTITTQARELALLFRETGHAHHRAFLATNGDDPDWPRWYAEYLAPRLEPLLGIRVPVDQLARLLMLAEDVRQSRTPMPEWPEFYAEYFLARM